MKTFSLFTLLSILLAFPVSAEKISASKVPSSVKSNFEKQFPGIRAKWEKEEGNYEASFKKDGKCMSAVFTENGSLKETETNINPTALPVAVQDYVKKKYPTLKIKEAAEIKREDGTLVYEAEVKGKDLLFDAQGNLLTSKPE